MLQPMAIPHPFPYQGSKRGLARHILAHFPPDVDCLIEPFCGSGAVSLAAAAHRLAKRFWLNDLNEPLMVLWEEILQRPNELSKGYERLWTAQHPDKRAFFRSIRDEFNAAHRPHHLLYLLARIVKGSVRYSAEGLFNQSADNRRAGMRPILMQRQILGVHALLAGKTTLSAVDFRKVVAEAAKEDVIYMDPPYQGTSFVRDQQVLERAELCRVCRRAASHERPGAFVHGELRRENRRKKSRQAASKLAFPHAPAHSRWPLEPSHALGRPVRDRRIAVSFAGFSRAFER